MELGNSSRPTHLTISTAPSSLAVYAMLCLFCFLLFRSLNQARRLKARHGSELGATFKTNHLFFHIKHGGHRELASVATERCLSERRKTTEPSLFLKFTFFWIFSRIRCIIIIMQYFILKNIVFRVLYNLPEVAICERGDVCWTKTSRWSTN